MRSIIFVFLFSLLFILPEPTAVYSGESWFRKGPKEIEPIPTREVIEVPDVGDLLPALCPDREPTEQSAAWVTFVVQTDFPNQKAVFHHSAANNLKTYFDGSPIPLRDQTNGAEIYVGDLTDIEKVRFKDQWGASKLVYQFHGNHAPDPGLPTGAFPLRVIPRIGTGFEIPVAELRDVFSAITTTRADGVKEVRLMVEFCEVGHYPDGSDYLRDNKFVIDIKDQYAPLEFGGIYSFPSGDLPGPSFYVETPPGRAVIFR